MTSKTKQILIVLGVLATATGISILYWRRTPKRLKIVINEENRKAIEDAELE